MASVVVVACAESSVGGAPGATVIAGPEASDFLIGLGPTERLLTRVAGCSIDVKVLLAPAGPGFLARGASAAVQPPPPAATPHPSTPVLRAAEGALSLTTNRVIFEADRPATSPPGEVHAAAFPIAELQDAHYTQPWFSANQFVFSHTRGAPDGSGMVVSLAVEITFDNSGGDTFMMQWAHAAARISTQRAPAVPPSHPEYGNQQERIASVAAAAEVFSGTSVTAQQLADSAAVATANLEATAASGSGPRAPAAAYYAPGTGDVVLVPKKEPDCAGSGGGTGGQYQAFGKKNE